ncbi:centrosomal protein of 162 kDa-like [Ptychodera flava]|uniref:centrosomal protein of 162 kDa-like n=1 Tax=Ptychodera flava TaxID=63121 RepID=UPI00396A9C53
MKKRFSSQSSTEMDEKFEQFMKESLSDVEDSVDSDAMNALLSGRTSARGKAKDLPWWMQASDEDDPLQKSGKSWLKPKKTEEKTEEKIEETKSKEKPQLKKQSSIRDEVGMSKDSLEDQNYQTGVTGVEHGGKASVRLSSDVYSDSTMTSTGRDFGPSPGADTLEEAADKERFFRELEEKKGTKNIDYSKLNKETDLSGTLGTVHGSRTLAGIEEKDEDIDSSSHPTEEIKYQPVQAEKGEAKPVSGGMLAKVLLDDSVDSSLGTLKLPGASHEHDGSSNKGLLNAGTATQMEALHGLYHDAVMSPTMQLEDTGNDTLMKDIKDAYASVGDLEETGTLDQQLQEKEIEITESHDAEEKPHDADKLERTKTIVSTRGTALSSNVSDFGLLPSGQLHGFDLTPAAEARGFDLQPAMTETQESRGFDLTPAADSRGFELSPVPVVDSRGFSLSPAHEVKTLDFDMTDGKAKPQVVDKPKKQPRTIKVQSAKSKVSRTQTKSGKRDSKQETKPKDTKTDGKKEKSKKEKDKYKHIKSSDYGSKKGWSPAETAQQKVKGSETISMVTKPYDTQLLASVESFAQYIKDHFGSEQQKDKPMQNGAEELSIQHKRPLDSQVQQLSRERALLSEVQDWQSQWKEEHKQNQKMRAEIISLQRHHERELEEIRIHHENDIFRVKQENIILVAKLNNEEQGGGTASEIKSKIANVKDSQEKIKLMEKEMQHQETLLEGYHQENKRLYKEIQDLKSDNKEYEAKWKTENQKMKSELTNLRDNLDEKDKQLKYKGVITSIEVQKEIAAGTGTAVMGASKIAQLQAELQDAQVTNIELKQRIKSLEVAKTDLEKHVEVLVRQNKDAESRVLSAMGNKDRDVEELKKQHEKDTEGLRKKLKWYSENQDLLDRDAKALKEKDEMIQKLEEQIQQLQQQKDDKRKLNETQRRARERAADAKKIQDLERQVKEMENILRRRHPNSLPALIYAAATAPTENNTSPASKSQAIVFLEERIQKLERELDEREMEAKKSLRTMEQRYNTMKLKFEEHISRLERELDSFKRADHSAEHPHTHVVALERELKSVRERYQRETEDLRERLDFYITSSKGKSPTRESKTLEMRLEELEDELRKRDEEMILLRLRYQQLETQTGQQGISQSDRRHYKAREFAGMHISDVIEENDRLKTQVERLSFEVDQQRVQLQKSLAEAESGARKSREEIEDRVTSLKMAHETEIQRLIIEHANKLTDSNVSQLNSQINAQQVMISHLKEQLNKYKLDSDKLAAAEIKEKAAKQQINLLTDELKEAKKSHTPEMRHFEALQNKILSFESRYAEREKELQHIITKATMTATAEKDEEIQYYKQQLRDKNVELQKFRSELDTLLEVIRQLKNQGVMLQGHSVKSFLQ